MADERSVLSFLRNFGETFGHCLQPRNALPKAAQLAAQRGHLSVFFLMAPLPRIFIEPPIAESVTLNARQSHHLVRVLRLRTGDGIELCDGQGRVWSARTGTMAPGACRIQRGALLSAAPPPAPELHLASAVLKGGAMDRLLRQATELGVIRIWPLVSARVQGDVRRAQARQAHWRKVILGACEQSRRVWRPRLEATRRLADFIAGASAEQRLLLHPGGEALPRDLPLADTALLIGPEGGWTDAEVHWAGQGGFRKFGLGAAVLRAETAPLAALAAIRHSWGWQA